MNSSLSKHKEDGPDGKENPLPTSTVILLIDYDFFYDEMTFVAKVAILDLFPSKIL